MKTNYFLKTYFLRTLANEFGSKSQVFFLKAKEAHRMHTYYADKVSILRNFLLNSPWQLFTIVYICLLIVDAAFMQPIVQTVVHSGFKMTGPLNDVLFMVVYILLITGLTIAVASAYSKLHDHRTRSIEIEVDLISNPGTPRSVIEERILNNEPRIMSIGLLCFGIMISLLIGLSLFRNYISNNFEIRFASPSDWLNIIIPISIGILLCYFGVYKDILIKLLKFKSKKANYEVARDKYQKESDHNARLAIEQNEEAKRIGDNTPYSADLKAVIGRYEKKSLSNEYFEEYKYVTVNIYKGGLPISYVQIYAFTEKSDATIYQITNSNGMCRLEWNTDSEFLSGIQVGSHLISGFWYNGDDFTIDLDGTMYAPSHSLLSSSV